MDRLFIKFLTQLIQEQHSEVDIFSWEFIFDPKFSKARNQHCVLGNNVEKRTLLSLLLHECMNDERRSALFPKTFDLGNHRIVPSRMLNINSLLGEIDLPPEDSLDPLRHIREGIKQLTGRSIDDYYKVDKSSSLKVIKTLYYLTRIRNESEGESKNKKQVNRLFKRLACPEGKKSGLEYRDSYNHKKSSAHSHLVGDAREYLGAELSTGKIIRIHEAFGSIESAYDKAIARVRDYLASIDTNTNESAQDVYVRLNLSTEAYRHPPPQDRAVHLDEALYMHVSSLPFRHFAQQYPNLHLIGIGEFSLMSIAEEINIETDNAIQIPVSDIPILLKDKADSFLKMASIVAKVNIDPKTLNKYAPLITAVIDRVHLFEPGQSLLPENRYTSPLHIVTAICAIHLEHINRTKHMPFWHGQNLVGDSLLESLHNDFNDEVVFEEHTQIWRVRLDWLFATICGRGSHFKQRSTVESLVLKRFSEIACMPNVESLENSCRLFQEHIRTICNKKFF